MRFHRACLVTCAIGAIWVSKLCFADNGLYSWIDENGTPVFTNIPNLSFDTNKISPRVTLQSFRNDPDPPHPMGEPPVSLKFNPNQAQAYQAPDEHDALLDH